MNDFELDSLLRKELEESPSPPLPDDLAGRVRKLRDRRRMKLRIATCSIIFVAALGGYAWHNSAGRQSVASSQAVDALIAKLDDLERKVAELQEKIKEQDEENAQIVEYRRALSISPAAAEDTPYGRKIRDRVNLEQTAYMLVGLGEERLALGEADEARRNFRTVVEKLPTASSAERAKELLAKMDRSL